MHGFARRLLLRVGMLVFLVSMPLALAVPPVFAGEPCPHEHAATLSGIPHEHPEQQPRKHHHGDAACLCCCADACVDALDMARAPTGMALLIATPIVYWEGSAQLTGRSLRPDPAPSRTAA